MSFNWSRYGGYECSSVGDKRFSAFNAYLPDGRSVEQHYQCDVKGYDEGGTNWRLGKGKPPIGRYAQEELYEEYLKLWQEWADHHLPLLRELYLKAKENNNLLSDRFATSPINQARALADILNNLCDPGDLCILNT